MDEKTGLFDVSVVKKKLIASTLDEDVNVENDTESETITHIE